MEKLRPELIPKVVERLKALADETRLRLLLRLREGEANVTDLSRELGVAQASVSKHLSTMRQVGLVQLRREGVQSVYSVRDQSVFDMCEIVCDGVVRHMREEHAALAPAADKGDERRARLRRRRRV
jgi:ArsR family transcriptional regulator